jgi:hypothetical protein
MTAYLFKGGVSIRNEIGMTSKKGAPRPPLISLKEFADHLGVPVSKLVSLLATSAKVNNPPPEPALRSNNSRGSTTYYHKAPALAWAKKAGLLK